MYRPISLTRFVVTGFFFFFFGFVLVHHSRYLSLWGGGAPRLSEDELSDIERTAHYYVKSPVTSPYKEKYGEVGRRAQQLREWLIVEEESENLLEQLRLSNAAERAAVALFPFLQNSPRNPNSTTPLADLRNSFKPGTRGLVLSTGSGTLRYAFHLIASLREVLGCTLPIEIAYAGDEDLPLADRELLQSSFSDIHLLDVLGVFDDKELDMGNGGWAIKPLAALASSFEEAIVIDADAVFLQKPEVLLTQEAYTSTGAFLFRDRLLWKGAYKDRHEWWESQVTNPSAALNTSLAFTERYAEEGESGVVVLDKSRLDVLVGLLHIAWQNSKEVRKTTFKMGHGDKESWWFGFELTGSKYAFEKHYASIVGWLKEEEEKEEGKEDSKPKDEVSICSFVIAHVDEQVRLVWYNGGLLENKKKDKEKFGLPTHWMVDGTWKKSGNTQEMSCLVGKEAPELSIDEQTIISRSIGLAQELDARFELL